MKKISETTSLWAAETKLRDRAPLLKDASADVCVIGGGIAGLSVAFQLARAGASVILLEADRLGGGETERTTAHLAVALDEGWTELVKVHGEERARLAAASHAAAIDVIESTAAALGIDCGFERLDGWLFGTPEQAAMTVAERDASLRAGILGAQLEPRAPLPAFATGPAIRYPGQAQFQPLRYLAGLADAVEKLGGRVHCGTRAKAVTGGTSPVVELENGKKVRAKSVVVATNNPFVDRLVLQTKMAQYRTYVVGAPLSEKGETPRALYWDLDDPYHYARLAEGPDGRDVLIVGGEDHKTGQDGGVAPEERWGRLEAWARERFPGFGDVTLRWSGQVVGTSDGLAFIGRNPGSRGVYVATGDCGHGMTHGVIAGMLIPSLIAGEKHPWEELYDPSRVHPLSVARWARENLNAAAQYASHLSPGEAASVADIEPGSGAVIRRGLTKVAVYKTPDGAVVERSAVCPHLGAVICWNAAERTWDCPAHGSRFAVDGRVLNGPAAGPLSPAGKAERPRRRKSRTPLKRRSRARFAKKRA